MTRLLTCAAILTARGWLERPIITLDADGCVRAIEPRAAGLDRPASDLGGFVVPGLPNAHSHAFQYAMTGLAEHLAPGNKADDFWSWREAMYGLARTMSPARLEAVAACVYSEMLRQGITAVAEFHYLHHAPDGTHYPQAAEMSARLIAGAKLAGIHLTLVPVFYAMGGFDQPAKPAQQRFLSPSVDGYRQLLAAVARAGHGDRDFVLGRGVHSLRAARAADVKAIFAEAFAGPSHLHIAEQRQEVEDCVAHWKKRPVQWLLDEVAVDARFSLVHATHMDADETSRLARSGATAVLCPSTEGNLGDGFFPLTEYVAAGGQLTIGTDSHVGLSPFEEMRWLDYGQRLRAEKRNVLCARPGDDSGALLFGRVWRAGQRALGLAGADYFDVGTPFDALVLDAEHPAIYAKAAERRLSALIYAGDASVIKSVLRRGSVLVQDGKHVRGGEIHAAFRDARARS